MKYRNLGNSGIAVSEIAFGSWLNFTDARAKANAIACVHRALTRGITLLDTANVYGRGAAESVLGEALAGVRRDSYVLATKLFFPMSEVDKGLSRAQIEKQLDASLERLRVDYVDLYQCHRFDPATPLEETMEALTRAVSAGKVRHLGFSEWPVSGIEAAATLPGTARFVSSQPQYSMLHRDPEKELLAVCARLGISQIVWSPLAQGILTGKYLPGAPVPADSRAAKDSISGFMNDAWRSPPVLQAVQDIQKLAKGCGLTMAQFALAWVLRQPNVASAIIGASRPEQIDENIVASNADVPHETFAEAERLLDAAS